MLKYPLKCTPAVQAGAHFSGYQCFIFLNILPMSYDFPVVPEYAPVQPLFSMLAYYMLRYSRKCAHAGIAQLDISVNRSTGDGERIMLKLLKCVACD